MESLHRPQRATRASAPEEEAGREEKEEEIGPSVPSGQIVILNGAPRSGKSSIVVAIQETFAGPWLNLGVDVWVRSVTPVRYRPGLGLRPGEDAHPVKQLVPIFYAGLYESIAAHSRLGMNVVVDVGHYDLEILKASARRLHGLPVLFIGVRCPIEVIMERRNAGQRGREGEYAVVGPGEPIPAPVLRWQELVHKPGIYDLEVDSAMTATQSANAIRERLARGPGDAFERIARL